MHATKISGMIYLIFMIYRMQRAYSNNIKNRSELRIGLTSDDQVNIYVKNNVIRCTKYTTEMTMGQRVMGHGSNGSTNLNGSRGSRVSTRDLLTHD